MFDKKLKILKGKLDMMREEKDMYKKCVRIAIKYMTRAVDHVQVEPVGIGLKEMDKVLSNR